MSIAEPSVEQFANPIAAYVAATRPPFILASVIPIFLGLGYSVYDGYAINWFNVVLTMLAGVLLHAAINVLNDYYDALNGTDDLNQERVFPFTGGSRFIQNEVLTRKQTLFYGIGLVLAVLVIAIYLISQTGMTLFWLGLFGVLLGWGYSAPPLNLNSRGLGELSVLAGFGLLPLGTYLVQTGELSLMLVLVSLPVGLLTANLLYINQFPDRKADIQANKLHWVARLSPNVARWGYVLIASLAWLTLVTLVVAGWLPLLALISALPAILSIKAARILLQNAERPQNLAPAIQMTILVMLAHGALLTLALVLDSLVRA
ncbi:MAG: prenyltransferase [Gammaproteobacteria bacterium]|nr:prenyltransferase [Gammaproteobacteria bacterium]